MKNVLRIFVTVCIFVLPLSSFAEVIGGIAAVVNEEPVTTYEVEKELDAMEKALGNSPAGGAEADRYRQAALDSIINRKLIAQKIRELDIRVGDDEVRQAIEDVKRQNNISQETLVAALNNQGISFEQYKAQVKEQLERLRLISQEVRSKIQINEKELLAFYNSHPEKFAREDSFRARVITFRLPEKASPEEKKRIEDKAAAVHAEAKGGKSFAELAEKHSDDPSAREGGDLGSFKRGEMLPEFETVLTGLSPGEISNPFVTQAGIHIVKLEEHVSGDSQSFDKVKGEIEDFLYKQKSEERFNQWLADLRKNAAIEIRP